jgi:hypothetical protein
MRLPVADPVDYAFETLRRGTGERRRSDTNVDVTRQHPFDMIEGCAVASVFRTNSCCPRQAIAVRPNLAEHPEEIER